jgi:hypothetical protein
MFWSPRAAHLGGGRAAAIVGAVASPGWRLRVGPASFTRNVAMHGTRNPAVMYDHFLAANCR